MKKGFQGLSTRVKTILENIGIGNDEDIKEAIEWGWISEKNEIRNLGRKGYIEICTAVGIRPKLKKKKKFVFNPYTGEKY